VAKTKTPKGVCVIKHLRMAYAKLNKGLFNSRLPAVRFSPNYSRKQVFFFISPSIIEIGAGFSSATKVDVLDELLHVMVHISNHCDKIDDVTRNQYHKIGFCNAALAVGLVVTCHSTRGWGETSSSCVSAEKLRKPETKAVSRRKTVYRQIVIPDNDLARHQRKIEKDLASKPTKQFQYKYVCDCDPPYIVRVGKKPDGPKPFKAACGYCDAKFVLDD